MAAAGGEAVAPFEVRAYTAPAAVEEVAPRAEPPRIEKPPTPPPPLTRPQFVRRFYAAIDAGRFGQAWGRLGPAVARDR